MANRTIRLFLGGNYDDFEELDTKATPDAWHVKGYFGEGLDAQTCIYIFDRVFENEDGETVRVYEFLQHCTHGNHHEIIDAYFRERDSY